MPFRIDIAQPPPHAYDRLVELGALDVELTTEGLAAIMPDACSGAAVARALGIPARAARIRAARGRDEGSVWILAPRPILVRRLWLRPADAPPEPSALRLIDSDAFGTGLHPTTLLCLELLDDEIAAPTPSALLDVGTGSGILALAALSLGVPHATAIDIDDAALRVTVENARLNGLTERLTVIRGGPEVTVGMWPLIVANVLAAPLVEVSAVLSQRVGRAGRLILSGIHASLADDVARAYVHHGLHAVRRETRDGWSALVLAGSW